MRTIIIDDEKSARDTIRAMLNMFQSDINIIGEADSVATGKEVIETQKPDLVFLDIRMKDGTGFDMLRQIVERDFALIFLTAHDDHALEAFRFSATDYLLKPVEPEDLQEAVDRVRRQNRHNEALMDVLLENIQRINSSSKKIVLKTSDSIHLFSSDDIVRCESFDNYSRIFVRERKPLLISRPLKYFDEMLDAIGFLRIHQSHLINLAHIRKIDRKGAFSVEMSDGSIVPVSIRKKETLISRLEDI
jgi:two-component system LytT family response regulator